MSWPSPRTLTDEEVYSLTAYILAGQQTHRRGGSHRREVIAAGQNAEP
jgi:hypothetical protein